jgi:hypothetical protein
MMARFDEVDRNAMAQNMMEARNPEAPTSVATTETNFQTLEALVSMTEDTMQTLASRIKPILRDMPSQEGIENDKYPSDSDVASRLATLCYKMNTLNRFMHEVVRAVDL